MLSILYVDLVVTVPRRMLILCDDCLLSPIHVQSASIGI